MTGVRSRKGTVNARMPPASLHLLILEEGEDILIHIAICEDENGGFEYLLKVAVEL